MENPEKKLNYTPEDSPSSEESEMTAEKLIGEIDIDLETLKDELEKQKELDEEEKRKKTDEANKLFDKGGEILSEINKLRKYVEEKEAEEGENAGLTPEHRQKILTAVATLEKRHAQIMENQDVRTRIFDEASETNEAKKTREYDEIVDRKREEIDLFVAELSANFTGLDQRRSEINTTEAGAKNEYNEIEVKLSDLISEEIRKARLMVFEKELNPLNKEYFTKLREGLGVLDLKNKRMVDFILNHELWGKLEEAEEKAAKAETRAKEEKEEISTEIKKLVDEFENQLIKVEEERKELFSKAPEGWDGSLSNLPRVLYHRMKHRAKEKHSPTGEQFFKILDPEIKEKFESE